MNVQAAALRDPRIFKTAGKKKFFGKAHSIGKVVVLKRRYVNKWEVKRGVRPNRGKNQRLISCFTNISIASHAIEYIITPISLFRNPYAFCGKPLLGMDYRIVLFWEFCQSDKKGNLLWCQSVFPDILPEVIPNSFRN